MIFLEFLVEKDYFERREFSFTLPGDIYVRYQSFDNVNEMEKAIQSKLPEKIDIGAVFNIKPKDCRNIGIVPFKAEEHELVFDIDMTDYDDIRTCCKGAEICANCWPFMVVAAKILDRALREDFGFRHLLWVYSGRRGIHCWVTDKRARKLSGEARNAVAEYLSLIQGGEFKAKKVTFDSYSLHPSIEKAIDIIDCYFESLILDKQKLLETKEQIKAIIDLCPDLELKKQLESNLYKSVHKSSTDRWNELVLICKTYIRHKKKHKCHLPSELKVQLCYPRLDINVTKGLNHLLKTPFSVHPKTGKICVPIDFSKIDTFDPFKVPNINELCSQIDSINQDENKDLFYEKTALNESIKIFQKFIKGMHSDPNEIRKKSEETTEF